MDPNNISRVAAPVAYSRPPPRPFKRLKLFDVPDIGAHLITPWMGFAHHGIYVGGGKVIHYGALVYDIIRRPVEEVTIEAFACGRPVFVVQHESLPFEVDEIIQRARSRLGENRYRLLTNNCEHFVEWCLYGEARSFQVQRALEFPRCMGDWVQGMLMRCLARLLRVRPVKTAKIAQPPKDN